MKEETHFAVLKDLAHALGLKITKRVPGEHLLVVSEEFLGLDNVVLDVESPLLIMEKLLATKFEESDLRQILRMNGDMGCGAFALTDAGIVFRETFLMDTLTEEELRFAFASLSISAAELAIRLGAR